MRATLMTLSIATLALTIMISYSPLQAEATKSGTSNDWCYISAFPEDRSVCLPNHKECNKAQSSDVFASSSCFKQFF